MHMIKHIHASMHPYIHTYISMHETTGHIMSQMAKRMITCIKAKRQMTHIHACIHACIHKCIHTYMHTCAEDKAHAKANDQAHQSQAAAAIEAAKRGGGLTQAEQDARDEIYRSRFEGKKVCARLFVVCVCVCVRVCVCGRARA